VIVKMSKIRILGPRDRLPEVLRVLQDTGVLHLSPPRPTPPLLSIELTPSQQRLHRNLRRVLSDLDAIGATLLLPPELASRDPVRRTLAARGTSPGTAALAADEFEVLADLLLDAAPRELVLRRLAAALAQTTRQVNTLEHRVTPALEARLAAIRGALEEREREEHTRLIWLTGRARD